MRLEKVGIVGGLRTPFAKAGTVFAGQSIYDMGKLVCEALCACHPDIAGDVDEIIGATVYPTGNLHNFAREIALGMCQNWHGYTVSRACGSGLQTLSSAVGDIYQGLCDVALCVGAESLSSLPPGTPIAEFHSQKTMGEYADRMAKAYDITREAQDAFSRESHEKAYKATAEIHSKLICQVPEKIPPELWKDGSVRYPSDPQKMASLPPVFSSDGSITAANASPVSDGAVAVLVASQSYLKDKKIKPWAWIRQAYYVAVPPEDHLLIGPAYVIPLLLEKTGLSAKDIDLWDMHEAFAAQTLTNLKHLESEGIHIPKDRFNIYGGSVALGHPFAATGLRMAMTIAYAHHQGISKRSLLSACTAGGMGAGLILEAI